MSAYMITNGNNSYIWQDRKRNMFIPVYGKELGTVWTDQKKAVNIYNALPKDIKSSYSLMEVDATDNCGKSTPTRTEVQKGTNVINDKGIIDSLADVDGGSIRNFEKWKSRVEVVIVFLQDTDDRMSELVLELSEADREVSDLLHYMEFNNFNACQGYIAYKKMHDLLLKRREIKNEGKVLRAIRSCSPTTSGIKSVMKAINNMDTQKYRPRVLGELFSDT